MTKKSSERLSERVVVHMTRAMQAALARRARTERRSIAATARLLIERALQRKRGGAGTSTAPRSQE